MSTIAAVTDPEARFVKPSQGLPAHGRGAWNGTGKANGSWRYEMIDGKPKIGSNAEKSLDAWATCAGSYGYQTILQKGGFLRDLADDEKGLFGPDTRDAVKAWQRATKDVETGAALYVDGTIGVSDSKALLAPVLDAAEDTYNIPDRLLRGETAHESALDLGAVGYYIFYGETLQYRGVDRGVSQINSEYNPQVSWRQAFDPYFAVDWSGKRMRSYYDQFRDRYPGQDRDVLWMAAVLAHNNPSGAGYLAKNGTPRTSTDQAYVNAVLTARF
jgi:hypothetical protein